MIDARLARVVELRYFGSLNVAETAETLAVSPDTVMRDWRMARLWLFSELGGGRDVRPVPRGDAVPSRGWTSMLDW